MGQIWFVEYVVNEHPSSSLLVGSGKQVETISFDIQKLRLECREHDGQSLPLFSESNS